MILHINSNFGNPLYNQLMDPLFELGVDQRVYKFIRTNVVNTSREDFVDVRVHHTSLDRAIFHVKHYKAYKDFVELYQDKKIDLIHAHTLFSNGYIAYTAKKQFGIPYIVAVRGTDVFVFFRYMLHLRNMGRRILQEAEKIIFISPAHKEMMFNKYIPKAMQQELLAKTVVIPNGINPIFFKSGAQAKQLDPTKEITILTVAEINRNKNQLGVCKAIKKLRQKGYLIVYQIVGEVKNDHIRRALEKYSFVEILAKKTQRELIDIYRQADIFAMVSRVETFGLAYIEALSQGTPIIYSEGQGVDGYITEGKAGYPARAYSSKDIADKIECVINNYAALSEQALEKSRKFDWSIISLMYKAIYDEITSKDSH